MLLEEFIPIAEKSYEIGFMEAVKSYEPAQDRIRATELKKWLKMVHLSANDVERYVRAGLIKPFQLGESRNSPIYYSKSEIKKAFLTCRALNMM